MTREMSYADMDKRKLMLPDLLPKPLFLTNKKGEMIGQAAEIPPDCYVFFYPIQEWIEIKEIRGEK